MATALVTPKIIKWARERRSLEITEVAEKINVEPERLESWENGQAAPTFHQAKTIAEKLYIPFGYLFLNQPPEQRLPLPDFRTIAGAPSYAPSPDFFEVLSDALRKQQWYHDYQERMEAESLDFVGKYSVRDAPQIIAADIRNTIPIDRNMRVNSHNWEQFLQEFIRRTETHGILVLRSGIVGNNTHRPLDVEEFRGFLVSDILAPIIFINGRDAKAAQIFTLAHELAHLWLGQSGVSNPDYFNRLDDPQNNNEKIANKIAAETLLPSDEFLINWDDNQPKMTNIERMARRNRISQFVVLRIAYDNHKYSENEYYEEYQRLLAEHHQNVGTSGGNFYRTLLSRNSSRFTNTLVSNVAEGKTSQREAATLLNVKVKSIPKIQKEILGEN